MYRHQGSFDVVPPSRVVHANPGGREYATELNRGSTVNEQIHAKSARQLEVSVGFTWSHKEDTPSKHVRQRHPVVADNLESVVHHGATSYAQEPVAPAGPVVCGGGGVVEN